MEPQKKFENNPELDAIRKLVSERLPQLEALKLDESIPKLESEIKELRILLNNTKNIAATLHEDYSKTQGHVKDLLSFTSAVEKQSAGVLGRKQSVASLAGDMRLLADSIGENKVLVMNTIKEPLNQSISYLEGRLKEREDQLEHQLNGPVLKEFYHLDRLNGALGMLDRVTKYIDNITNAAQETQQGLTTRKTSMNQQVDELAAIVQKTLNPIRKVQDGKYIAHPDVSSEKVDMAYQMAAIPFDRGQRIFAEWLDGHLTDSANIADFEKMRLEAIENANEYAASIINVHADYLAPSQTKELERE